MTHGSLFSGLGGFDLAAEWMGWENLFHCEWNEFGQRILKYYWPHAKSYGDIDTTDFTVWRGLVDVLSGGFPCQPYSTAGKRKGKDDDRHKWPQMLRAIREIQPTWVVGENVRGLTNWNRGLVFDEVQADLEAECYEVLSFLLPAAGVNAPHRRERIWFIAHSHSNGLGNIYRLEKNRCEADQIKGKEQWQEREVLQREWNGCDTGRIISEEPITNSNYPRRKNAGAWDNWPTVEPEIRCGNDGLSTGLDGITFSKWRNESIKAYGNAIVPQVAFEIFKVIGEMNKHLKD